MKMRLGPQLVNCLGRIRRCGPVEDLSHWGWALRFQKSTPGLVALCLLPMDQDEKLSATAPGPCLSASHREDNGQTLENPRQAPDPMHSFLRVGLVTVSLHCSRTVT